jgi:hypothetical protein
LQSAGKVPLNNRLAANAVRPSLVGDRLAHSTIEPLDGVAFGGARASVMSCAFICALRRHARKHTGIALFYIINM